MSTYQKKVSADLLGRDLKAAGLSRRDVLRALAAAGITVGAGALLPASGVFAQTTRSGSRGRPGRIDVHHHFSIPNWSSVSRVGSTWNWTAEKSLEQMDKYGITTSILSITQPGVWFGDVQQARALSRETNDFGAKVIQDHPGRFGLFAALPFPDTEGTLREIEYAFDTLKADGICLMTSYGNQWLGDPAFVPALEELNRRNAVVFVHVTGPACCRTLVPGVTPTMSEYDFDTTRTVNSMLVNGTLSRFPNVKVIFVHSGGTLPVLAGRINDRFPKDRMDRVPNGVMHELKKLYYEVAHATYAMPLAALTKFVPVSQILFGTDYPAEAVATTTEPLVQFGLSSSDLQAIDRGNAERLLPRFKA